MPARVSPRGHGERNACHDNTEGARQEQEGFGPGQRPRHARLPIRHRQKTLTGQEARLNRGAPPCDGRFLARKKVGVLHPAAGLYHPGGRDVLEIHHQARPEGDETGAGIGLAHQHCRDAQARESDLCEVTDTDTEGLQQARICPHLAARGPR